MASIISSFLVTASASAILLAVIMRVLPAGFLAAAVTERSNHTQAARQLGGLALVPAILCSLWIFGPDNGLDRTFLVCASLASILLWVIGFLDDRHHLPESVRLISQLAASAIAIYGLGSNFRLLPELLPFLAERGLLVVALVYFINLTNFMDGLDLMVVSGLGVPLAILAGFSAFGLAAIGTGNLAASIAGGLAGFALFNRPKARVFLGDSGSLPLGLIGGLTCFLVARDTSIWVGLILPLFFIADATSTLLMRLAVGENIFAAHSKHAYQVAKRSGWSVWHVVLTVALLNIILGGCAFAAAQSGVTLVTGILLALFAVTLVLYRFRTGKG
ncbi:glycoside hydrolase [Phyllobacterium lublinensis]|uniref:glycoside hydrolase n=1 Tax=Phyllobacterium lublinensis TaxID=2875708 RepID=UPI001CCCEFD9|nr:glycoside hydrolase [Phyllobacterium sp. 2063]MBZ9654277.1 glycoside hydrolase [Phyllobacterium sp. 2063]